MIINGQKYRVTRKLLEEWLQQQVGLMASSVEYVEDFDERGTRHICLNGHGITLLQPRGLTFEDEDGRVDLRFYACSACGKYIIQKNDFR